MDLKTIYKALRNKRTLKRVISIGGLDFADRLIKQITDIADEYKLAQLEVEEKNRNKQANIELANEYLKSLGLEVSDLKITQKKPKRKKPQTKEQNAEE